ncbi:MAG: hypothetical protein CSA09_03505 [Candidatus Contendobacter odensis]|uniref:Uncharacterized protein n=1 Tax=Candidatus Contendibacter odensensis TaxID=1400860 RepID=A0A2G6PEZ7_9GAMM|nr:MAG: hypothetical protein CSA09_03505 [Candidatus Contendobacter odensis]
MNKLDGLWQNILSSTDANAEYTAVEALWKHIANARLQVAINVIEDNGNEIDIMDYTDRSSIKKVAVNLSKGDKENINVWTPIDPENIYILFREK